MLDLSKIEAGQFKLSLANYSVADLVQTVVSSTEVLAADKKLRLDVDMPGQLPRGRGDAQRLTQVLLNLVGNAIKFTDKGSVSIKVAAADGQFLVEVADTGPGIPPGEQQRIFEEFQQVDSSSTRKQGGTGLGIAIAKRIVEMHEGRIWVESELDRGSCFRVQVPMRVKEALDMHLRTQGAPVADLAPQGDALGVVADTLGMLGLGVPRKVVQDPAARYWGGLVDDRSLVPLGEARLGRIGLDEWVRRSQAKA